MKFLQTCMWNEVFAAWREREESFPGWTVCAQEKGWPDWHSWRQFTAEFMKLPDRKWSLWQFEDPLLEIPQLYVGPYGGWQARVRNKHLSTFAEMLENDEQLQFWKRHKRVQEIQQALPFSTQFVGLYRKDVNHITCMEGHHRAVAYALRQLEPLSYDITVPITIALADIESEECVLFEQLLERGTSKEPRA